MIASAALMLETTAAIMRSSSRERASRIMPGVSKRIIWYEGSLAMPTTRWRVVWGLYVTMDSFCPTSALMPVDGPNGGAGGGCVWGGGGGGVEEEGGR
jgi:hypothetical protein